MNHVDIKSEALKNACVGCSLCANLCPKNAISMEWSEDGFLVPQVDASLCCDCGLCKKSCPALKEWNEPPAVDFEAVKAYGAWHKNEKVREASSSGGVFSAMAHRVIDGGGCVFGVVWKDKHTAVYTKAATPEELVPMLGSKYVQAVPGMVYREVKAELKTGKQVFFSGLPCQVAALRSFLKKDYDNLLTMDILCHGVPSRNAFLLYTQKLEKETGKILDYVSFREKDNGWATYTVANYFRDGTRMSTPFLDNGYMKIFLFDAVLNKGCLSCKYARIPRPGDITAGDFWGVEGYYSQWPAKKGISAVLGNTEKGRRQLSLIEDMLHVESIPYAILNKTQGSAYVRNLKQDSPKRPYVEAALQKGDFDEAVHQSADFLYWKGFRIRQDMVLYRVARYLYRRFLKKKK